MRTVQAESGKAIIRFEYDPDAVEKVKAIPGRRWNADEKFWWVIVTPEVQPHLLELRDNFGFKVDPAFELPKESFRGENLLDTEWNPPEGVLKEKLYPYQRAGVEWALKRIARSEGKNAEWYLQKVERISEKNDALFGNRENQKGARSGEGDSEREIQKSESKNQSFGIDEKSYAESDHSKETFTVNEGDEAELQGRERGSSNRNHFETYPANGKNRTDSGSSSENEKKSWDADFLQTGFRKSGNEDRSGNRRPVPLPIEEKDARRKKNQGTRSDGVGNNSIEQQRGFIIADEPGVGKTAQAIALAKLSDGLPALVVCPASLKINWAREIERWTGERATIMGKGPQDYWFGTGNWMIVNYDILDRFEFPEFKTIIADEAHYLKNGKTKRSDLFKQLSKKAKRVIMLTGTPVLSRPAEIVNLLTILEYMEKFGGWWKFMTRYCNPPEAPIWMEDLSFKKLGEIRVGDKILGWSKEKNKRRKITKSVVLEIKKRNSKIIKIIFESGREIRCTQDHYWLSCASRGDGSDYFVRPKVGKTLSFVVEPTKEIPVEKIRDAGWLSGIYDGEATGDRIAQSKKANPIVWKKIEETLKSLDLSYSISKNEDAFYLTGGFQNKVKFLNWCRPEKSERLINKIIGKSKVRQPDKIVEIKEDGYGEVISMTTSTGNYFAWGYASKNCGAYRGKFGIVAKGANNIAELSKLLRDVCMIRREKTEVLKDLPEKTRTVIEMELPDAAKKSYERAESDFIEWLQQQEGDEAARRAMQAETLVRIGKLRQLAARGRMVPTCEWIDDFIETGRKLVVFGWHKDILYELGAKYGAPVITGDTPLEHRQEYVDRFQEDPETKILVLGIRAGGVGLTLTAASDVLFVETGWTAGEMDQAEDRCHRIGQKNNVACYYAFAPGTIDEYLMDLIEEKRNIYRRTMGEENKIRRSKGKIGEVLMGIILKNQMEKEST